MNVDLLWDLCELAGADSMRTMMGQEKPWEHKVFVVGINDEQIVRLQKIIDKITPAMYSIIISKED